MCIQHGQTVRGCPQRGCDRCCGTQDCGHGEMRLLVSPGGCPQGAGDGAAQARGVLHPGSRSASAASNPWRPSSSSPCPHKTGSTFPSRSPRKKKKKKEEREREGGKEKLKICLL